MVIAAYFAFSYITGITGTGTDTANTGDGADTGNGNTVCAGCSAATINGQGGILSRSIAYSDTPLQEQLPEGSWPCM